MNLTELELKVAAYTQRLARKHGLLKQHKQLKVEISFDSIQPTMVTAKVGWNQKLIDLGCPRRVAYQLEVQADVHTLQDLFEKVVLLPNRSDPYVSVLFLDPSGPVESLRYLRKYGKKGSQEFMEFLKKIGCTLRTALTYSEALRLRKISPC